MVEKQRAPTKRLRGLPVMMKPPMRLSIDDASLSERARAAASGDELSARFALAGVILRLAEGGRPPADCMAAVNKHLISVLPADAGGNGSKSKLRAFWGYKRGRGRPRTSDQNRQMVEALTLAAMPGKGHRDLSEERAEVSGVTSSFAAAAAAMGYPPWEVKKVANRLRTQAQRDRRALKAKTRGGDTK